MIDCFGWCCRCWACALTVQNICHKFTFIWPNAADHPPPPSPPGYVLPMPLPRLQSNGFCANAGVAVDAVAAAACGGLVCRCLCSCGSVYAQCGPSRSQIRPVQAINAEGKREKERGRDSARVRKGRQAIRWRMTGIVQRCSIFKLSYQFRDWITWKKKERA